MTISPSQARRFAEPVTELYDETESDLMDDVEQNAVAVAVVTSHWNLELAVRTRNLRAKTRAVAGQLRDQGGRLITVAGRMAYLNGASQAATDLNRVGTITDLQRRVDERLVSEAVRVSGQVSTKIQTSVPQLLQKVVREASVVTEWTGGDRTTAVEQIMALIRDKGIPGFIDAAGRTWDMLQYVEMATRTIASEAMINGYKDQAQDLGNDLVTVVENPDSCPICQPWTDSVLSISGDTPTGDYDGYTVDGSVDEATADGLFHPNCRCVLDVFTPPASSIDSTAPPEEVSAPE